MSGYNPQDTLEGMLLALLHTMKKNADHLAASHSNRAQEARTEMLRVHEQMSDRLTALPGTGVWMGRERIRLIETLVSAADKLHHGATQIQIREQVQTCFSFFDAICTQISDNGVRAKQFCRQPLGLIAELVMRIDSGEHQNNDLHRWLDQEIAKLRQAALHSE